VRTIVARYVRTKNYTEAIHILENSAELLLKAGQGGSGSDLFLYLLEVYDIGEIRVDAGSRARLLKLLALVRDDDPTLVKIANEITKWSSQFGDSIPLGDPELHHVLGSKFAAADEAYEAEKHLLVGTRESPAILAKLLFDWYAEADDFERAPQFLSRGVFGYLSIENFRDAHVVTKKFIELLKASPDCGKKYTFDAEITQDGISISSELPLLNFLQLLIVTCEYKSVDMYRRLISRYQSDIADLSAWTRPLDQIAQQYFGIAPQRSNNMFQDILGSLMGGGGGSIAA